MTDQDITLERLRIELARTNQLAQEIWQETHHFDLDPLFQVLLKIDKRLANKEPYLSEGPKKNSKVNLPVFEFCIVLAFAACFGATITGFSRSIDNPDTSVPSQVEVAKSDHI